MGLNLNYHSNVSDYEEIQFFSVAESDRCTSDAEASHFIETTESESDKSVSYA